MTSAHNWPKTAISLCVFGKNRLIINYSITNIIIDINLFLDDCFCTAIVIFKQDYLLFSFETKVTST